MIYESYIFFRQNRNADLLFFISNPVNLPPSTTFQRGMWFYKMPRRPGVHIIYKYGPVILYRSDSIS